MALFQRKAAGGREMGGNNFDPLQTSLAQSGARVNERTLVPADGAGARAAQQGQPRSLLHFVEDLAQAALAARNEFLSEVNNAAAQHREVHEAARRRLEVDLAKLGDSASGLSNRLFFALKGPTPKRPSAAEAAEEVPAATAEQRLPPAPARLHAAAPGAADLEVETVNTRADLEELQSEITKLREQKQRAREADREEFETLVAAAAERRAAAEVAQLRAALERAGAQNAQLLAELETLAEHQSVLQERLHEAQVARGASEQEEGYHLDSVSVVPDARTGSDELGYANAVKRLEERVLSLSRQLTAEHDARERLEDVLRERGISVEHLRLATSGLMSSALLRTVRKTVVAPLPPDAPMKTVRAALAHLEQRCAEAEEGHASSTQALDNMLRVLGVASAAENGDAGAVMQALPALATLAAKGAAARALLSAGAAAAVGETMLAHPENAGLLCEACTTLCVLAGGLLSPLGLGAEAVRLELRNRDAMCEQVAAQAGPALLRAAVRQAGSRWVTLAVARTLGVVARARGAGQRLLALGAVQVLSRALASYAGDKAAYEVAHMSALALMALASTGAANAETVDKKGGRLALQQAVLVNHTLGRALGMEFPAMAAWLSGAAFKPRMPSLFACGRDKELALIPQAESLWLAAVREAAELRKPEARGLSRAASSTGSEAASQKPARARAAVARPQLPRKPLSSVASQPEEEEDFVAMQL